MDDKSPVGQSYRRNVPVRCVTVEARAIRDKHAASQVGQLFGLPTPAYLDQSARTFQRPISAISAAPFASSDPPPPVVQQRSEPLAADLAKATQTDSIGDKSTQAPEAMEQRAPRGELASRAGGIDGPELGPLLVQIPGASPTGRGLSALVHVTDAVVPVSVSAADAAPPITTSRQTELSSAPMLESRPFDDPNEEWRAQQQSMSEMRRDLRANRERNVRGQLAGTFERVAPTAQSTKFVALRQGSIERRYVTSSASAPMKVGAKDYTSDARRNIQRNETGEFGGLFRQENGGGLDAAANGKASAGVRVQLHAEESFAQLRRAASHSPSKVLDAANGMSAGVSSGSLQNGAETARANLTVTGPRCRTDDARNYYARNYNGHDIFGAGDFGEARQPIAMRGGTPLSVARVGSSPVADTTRTPAAQLNFHEEQLSAAHSKATESQMKRSTSPQVDHSAATQATGGDARLSPQRTPRCRTAEALSHFERNQSGQFGHLIRGELENSPRAAIRVRAEAVEIARVHRGDHLAENLHSYGTPRNQPDPLLPAVRLHRQTSAANAPTSSAIASEMTRSAVAASASARASEQDSVAGERVVKKSAATPLTARTPTKKAPAAKKVDSADAEQSAATPRVAAAGKTAVKKVTRATIVAAPTAANDSAAAEPQAAEEAAGSETVAPAEASASTGDSKQEAKPNETGPTPVATTSRAAASKGTPKKSAASARAVPKKADSKKNPVGESNAAPKATTSPKAIQKPAAVGASKTKASAAAALDKGETSKAKAIESPKAVPVKRPPRNAGAGSVAAAAAGGTAVPSQNGADDAADEKVEQTTGSLERGESVEHLMKPSLSASPNPILNGST